MSSRVQNPVKRKREVTSASSDWYQESGRKMMECTDFADAEVRCGDRTWKVHKSIVCARSEWFRAALTGSFEEGTTGVVHIKEFDPEEVDCLVTFLYTGAVDKCALGPRGIRIRIWELGDFFRLSELRELALQDLQHRARESIKVLSLKSNESHTVQLSHAELLVKAIDSIYGSEHAKLKHAFRPYVFGVAISGIRLVATNRGFKKLLERHPKFAKEWAEEMMAGVVCGLSDVQSGLHVPYVSTKCVKCSKLCSANEAWLDTIELVRSGRKKFICDGCFTVTKFT